MSYTPINWQTGQTITAEKLNKMDNGWGVQNTQLFSETVTTAEDDGMYIGTLVYSDVIDSETITVTFNGTEYTCPQKINAFGSLFYGGFSSSGPDFSVYPFAIQSGQYGNDVFTETAGTYTVTVAAEALAISDTFCTVVGKCIVVPIFEASGIGIDDYSCNMSFSELNTAVKEGRCFIAKYDNDVFNISEYNDINQISFTNIFIDNSGVTQRTICYYSYGLIEITETNYPSN